MLITFEERLSNSPFVERIWRSHSEHSGDFMSVASAHWEMVVSRFKDKVNVLVRGPESQATQAFCPENGEWIGIRFKLGTLMPHLPASSLVDGAIMLPEATSKSFWLKGSAWQFPDYENADTFVNRLVHEELVVRAPAVYTALRSQPSDLSLRSIQRHFMQVTGLTHGAISQIERARQATILLKEGASILDTVHQTGYADQPHLTRSLKRLIGLTPAQITDKNSTEQLSFLFKTTPLV